MTRICSVNSEEGNPIGLFVPLEKISELMANLKETSAFKDEFNRILSGCQIKNTVSENVMQQDQSLENSNESIIVKPRNFYNGYAVSLPIFYQDERCFAGGQFICANPDGSEDLIEYYGESNGYKIIEQLVSKGNGYWSRLVRS